MSEQYLANVRQQYEQFPYPPRNPEDERHRLLEVDIDRLTTINFYCFNGENDFNGARVLVAGGGTGDSTIFLAEQLRNKNAEVVYLDISEASIDVAKQRAKIRGLENIRWIRDSILTLSPATAGTFDYISCTGVLHHLQDPEHGLSCLESVLRPAGAMGIMVYAKYGRTGIYQLQKLLRIINHNETEMSGKIANARQILKELPESNWFHHNEHLLSDHRNLGDSGLVDLLLHEQDVAYGIEAVHTLLAQAGLRLVEFSDVRMRMSYRPEQYIQDPALLQKIARLDRVARQSIAELLVGAFRQHVFYASRKDHSRAVPGDPSSIPFFFPERDYRYLGKQIYETMTKYPNQLIPLRHSSGYEFDLLAEPVSAQILRHVDGTRDWRQIFAMTRAEVQGLDLTDQDLLDFFTPVFEQFRQFDWMLLRSSTVSEFPDTLDLQAANRKNRAHGV